MSRARAVCQYNGHFEQTSLAAGTLHSAFPTNKTQVFNEINMMENWLIIHMIISQPNLVL